MTMPYIINAALVLAACLAFYKVLLRRETFYKVNRYLLMICLFASFTLPLLTVPQQFSLRKKETITVNTPPTENSASAASTTTKSVLPLTANGTHSNVEATKNPRAADNHKSTVVPVTEERRPGISFSQLVSWVIAIYWFGVILFAASFLFQVGLLIYRAFHYPVIRDGEHRIVEISGDKAPCSFGNIIFINPAKYEWETYNQILLHEKIHIRQKHTVDILIAELVLIFQWFNPFAWFYRREIENNLEFLTDDQLMQHREVDKKSYQLSLVKVSAPHLPLRLTTNYNQSILKTRIAMMNRKRSNLHTTWKYFFLVPLLAFLTCLLNEPVANSQGNKNEKQSAKQKDNDREDHDIKTEGSWFATIKGDKISIRFTNDDDKGNNHNFSGNTYKLTELTPTPKEGVTSFKMTRDAGTMEFTGRFEANTGMGHYKFIADKGFASTMNNELKEQLDDEDLMTFFFVNVNKGYIADLKSEGYSSVTKEELIPLAALDVDKAFIHSMKNAGFKDLTPENLVSLKALGVDDKYVSEIRSAGFKNISTEKIVSFKAQGIDKEYITKVRNSALHDAKSEDDDDAEKIISFKALGIDDAFINSFKAVGMNNIPHEQLVSFKAIGVTPEYIKSWHAAGFKDIEPEEFVGMKSQDVTPEYMKSFTDLGYKKVKPENLVSFRALGITPEYIKSFEAIGYKNIDLDELTGLKAQNVTPEYVKSFEALGFKNIDLEDMVAVKAVGVTPEYIKDMRAKGFNYDRLEKYVTLKSID